MIVIDDFIKDEVMLQNISNKDGDFWKMGYHWWTGWWNNSANTLRQKLVHTIWTDHRVPILDEVMGFEHWTGVLSKDITIGDEKGYALNHHHDKDEGGGSDKPIIGTVYYPPMGEPQCEGGYLKVYSENDRNSSYELIAPVPNRLVIFDATQLHAVTEITKGKRYAIAINLWSEKPTTEMVEEI